MPLELVTNSVTGVYKGQSEPLTIGEKTDDFGPHKIGYTVNYDSVILQAFFDPSLSEKLKSSYEKYQTYYFTYIQVGQFRINNVPVTVKIHNNNAPFAESSYSSLNSDEQSMHFDPFWFVDICIKDSDGNPQKFPYYPCWIYQNDARFLMDKLSKYPFRYGGFTRVNNEKLDGDMLCASLIKFVDLGHIDLPYYIPEYFENKLDLENLIEVIDSNNKDWPERWPKDWQEKWPQTIDIMYFIKELQNKEIIPQDMQEKFNIIKITTEPFKSSLLNSIPLYHLINVGNRYFVSYRTLFVRHSNPCDIEVNIVIYANETEKKWVLAYLDYDPFELYRQDGPYLGTPDIDSINLTIHSKELKGKNIVPQPDKSITLSYKFITYACAIKHDVEQNSITIKLLEGFYWEVDKTYKTPENSFEMKVSSSKEIGAVDENIFINIVKDFFPKPIPLVHVISSRKRGRDD